MFYEMVDLSITILSSLEIFKNMAWATLKSFTMPFLGKFPFKANCNV